MIQSRSSGIEKTPASFHHIPIVNASAKAKNTPVKLWTYFNDFSPPMMSPMKFSEWNIIPSPVMHRTRQEAASDQWTILSKGVRYLNQSFSHGYSPPLPLSRGPSSGSFGPWMM